MLAFVINHPGGDATVHILAQVLGEEDWDVTFCGETTSGRPFSDWPTVGPDNTFELDRVCAQRAATFATAVQHAQPFSRR